MELVEIIKALAHENRLRMLNLLKEKPLCVCELRNIMDINQSNASRHLIKLKNVDLVDYQKEAQWVYYHVNSQQLAKFNFIKELLEKELTGHKLFQEDLKKLRLYNASEVTCETLDKADIF